MTRTTITLEFPSAESAKEFVDGCIAQGAGGEGRRQHRVVDVVGTAEERDWATVYAKDFGGTLS